MRTAAKQRRAARDTGSDIDRDIRLERLRQNSSETSGPAGAVLRQMAALESMKDLEEIKREVYSAGNFRQAFNPLAGNDAVVRPVEGGQQEGSPSPKSSVPHEIVPPISMSFIAVSYVFFKSSGSAS